MQRYTEFYRQSIDQPDAFWTNEAPFIDWHKPFAQVCDYSRLPFGSTTPICLPTSGHASRMRWVFDTGRVSSRMRAFLVGA